MYHTLGKQLGHTGTVDPSKGESAMFQNQSSIFKSNVERMNYLEPKLKTFIGGKLTKSRFGSKGLEATKSEAVMVPEISPGPGDYMSNQHLSTFKVMQKPHHLQFFGSTEERVPFVEKSKQKNDINQDFRGPGLYEEYEEDKLLRKKIHHKGYSSSFISGRSNDLLFSGNSNPGPGEYKTGNDLNRINGKVWSKNSTFGSTEKRFKQAIIENPGPGAYTRAKRERKKLVSG
mmetsp:Transcript_11436/g.12937  ORF Transcript_11436/g.12937 Transcript_11436/m.12937 type:complete len:231 (+) Transcript_11436:126-818(+)